MKDNGRAPKKRKLPLKKRVAIALVRTIEGKEQKKNSKRNAAVRTDRRPQTRRPVPRQGAQVRSMPQRPPMPPGQRQKMQHARRRKQRIRTIGLYAVMIGVPLVVLLIIILILSRTVLFKIQNIDITNPKDASYTASQIVTESGVVYGKQNLFSCDLDKVARNIEQRLPYIGKAQVERDFPKTLRVTVTPTRASAAIAFGTGYLLINEEGKMLEQVETAPDNVPVLRCKAEFEINLGQIIGKSADGKKPDDKMKEAASMITLYKRIYAALKEAQIQEITLIDIRDVRAITLMYQNRLTIHLGTQDQLEQKLKTGAKIIAEEKDMSKTRTGALDLTRMPYGFSRDTYASVGNEDTTDVSEPESETERAE